MFGTLAKSKVKPKEKEEPQAADSCPSSSLSPETRKEWAQLFLAKQPPPKPKPEKIDELAQLEVGAVLQQEETGSCKSLTNGSQVYASPPPRTKMELEGLSRQHQEIQQLCQEYADQDTKKHRWIVPESITVLKWQWWHLRDRKILREQG